MSDSAQARTSAGARERVRADTALPGPDAHGGAKADERRHDSRRSPRPNRSLVMPHAEDAGRGWFPRTWPYMIVCMAGAVVASALAAQAIPGVYGGSLLALAVAGACGAQPVFDRVRRRSTVASVLAALAVVVLPMFLFGLGMTAWTVRQGLPWDIAVAALLAVGTTAAVYLRRNPAVIFAGQLAMWSAVVLAAHSSAGAIMLLVGLAVALMVSREQLREQRREDE
ncbi:MAG TPA: hypothetical protein VFS49_03860, partial [Croceibacterium sp.]|nr:hypothetical protein [Croceibacterium sp.]